MAKRAAMTIAGGGSAGHGTGQKKKKPRPNSRRPPRAHRSTVPYASRRSPAWHSFLAGTRCAKNAPRTCGASHARNAARQSHSRQAACSWHERACTRSEFSFKPCMLQSNCRGKHQCLLRPPASFAAPPHAKHNFQLPGKVPV